MCSALLLCMCNSEEAENKTTGVESFVIPELAKGMSQEEVEQKLGKAIELLELVPSFAKRKPLPAEDVEKPTSKKEKKTYIALEELDGANYILEFDEKELLYGYNISFSRGNFKGELPVIFGKKIKYGDSLEKVESLLSLNPTDRIEWSDLFAGPDYAYEINSIHRMNNVQLSFSKDDGLVRISTAPFSSEER